MRKLIIIAAVLAARVGVGCWHWEVARSYDQTRVHPKLRALKAPYQSVRTGYFMDGGSVGIEIIDRDGRKEEFAIPAYLGEKDPYTKIFVGAIYARHAGAMEIAEPQPTRRMLVAILEDYPRRSAEEDRALLFLRESPVDWVRCFMHNRRHEFRR